MKYFKDKYYKIAQRLYSVGKKAFEGYHEELMFARGIIGTQTRFYEGSEIYNLSNERNNVTIGRNCHISGMIMTYNYGGCIKIGDNCSLGVNSRIISVRRIEIGNRVLIAHNVNIIDNISHPIDAQLRHDDFINSYSDGMKEYDMKAQDIIIGDDVWIGLNSVIMKGVKIGNGAIIGAGSMVTKDVKEWTVNVGNPLMCIRILEPVEVKDGLK
jgi:acetyltransferase-like isoleucine patch superfamily enzyme